MFYGYPATTFGGFGFGVPSFGGFTSPFWGWGW